MESNHFIPSRNWRICFVCTLCIGSSFYAQAQDLKDKDICTGTTVIFNELIIGTVATKESDTKAGWYIDDEWKHEPYGFTATPTVTTKYTLRFTKEDGTLYEKSLTITVYEPPNLVIPDAMTICSGTPVPLNATVTNDTPLTEIFWTYDGFRYDNKAPLTPKSTGEHIITATADNTPNTGLCGDPVSKDLHITVNYKPTLAKGEPSTVTHCTQEDPINLNDCIDFFVYDTDANNEKQPADYTTGTITWYALDNNTYIPVSDPEHVLLTSLDDTTFYADLLDIFVDYSTTCIPFHEKVTTNFQPIRVHITPNYFVLNYGKDTMCCGSLVEANFQLLDEYNNPSPCATITGIDILSDHSWKEEIISPTERTLVFPPFTGLYDTIRVKMKGSLPGLEKEDSLYLRNPSAPSISSSTVCINTDAYFRVIADRCDTIYSVDCPTLTLDESLNIKTPHQWDLYVPDLPNTTSFQCKVTYFSKLQNDTIKDLPPINHTLQVWEDPPELTVFPMYDDAHIPFDNTTQNLCLGDSLLFVFSAPHNCDTIKNNIEWLQNSGTLTLQDPHFRSFIVKPTQEGDITYRARVYYKHPKGTTNLTVDIPYTVKVKQRPHLFVDPPNTLKYCYPDDPPLNLNLPNPSADIIDYNFVVSGLDAVKFLAANGDVKFQPDETGDYMVEANYQYLCSAMTTKYVQDEVRIVVNNKNEDGATFIKLPDKRFCELEGITIESYNREGSSLKWEHDGTPITVFPEPYKPAAGTYTLTTLISNACYPDDPYPYSVFVEVVAVPKIEVMPDITVCSGDIVELKAEFVGDELIWTFIGGTFPPDIVQIDNKTFVQIENTTTFRGIAHYTDGVCGDAYDEVTITRMPYASLQLMPDTSACQGHEIQLRVVQQKDGDEIFWSSSKFSMIGTGESTPITVNGNETYTATISNRCSSYSADLKVTSLYLPEVKLKADTSVCYGESLDLSERIKSRGILQWTPNESTANTITEPTIYIATVTTPEPRCGSVSDTMYVNVYPPLMLLPDDSNLPHYNTHDLYDVSFQTLHAVPNLTYHISSTLPPGLTMINDRLYGQPVLGPADYNTHHLQVSVIDGHRCKIAKDYILAPEWKAANVLLPMGDAGNAIFLPDYSLEVYTRNGLLMHEGMGWNGTWNNAFVPAGTYFYKAKILIDGMPEERMNYVVVMYY